MDLEEPLTAPLEFMPDGSSVLYCSRCRWDREFSGRKFLSASVIAMLLSVLVLKERINRTKTVSLMIAPVGALIILRLLDTTEAKFPNDAQQMLIHASIDNHTGDAGTFNNSMFTPDIPLIESSNPYFYRDSS